MKILQIGLPKSGNFWLYKIIQNIIHEAQIENKSFIKNQPIYDLAKTWDLQVKDQINIDMLKINEAKVFYHISKRFKQEINNLDDYVNSCTHVWSHSWFYNLTIKVCSKFDYTIYIIRDQRDVAISLSKFVFNSHMKKYYSHHTKNIINSQQYLDSKLELIISDWVKHILGYLYNYQKLGIYIIFYERLLVNFDEEIKKLLNYLNLELSENSLAKIKQNVSLTNMKKNNPHHIKKGKIKQWINVLTLEQKERSLYIAKPLLELLQYPLNDQVDILPQLPQNLTQKIFDDLYQNLNLMEENQFNHL